MRNTAPVNDREASAAEFLRGYAPAGQWSLRDCLPYAYAATTADPARRARVDAAASLLGLVS